MKKTYVTLAGLAAGLFCTSAAVAQVSTPEESPRAQNASMLGGATLFVGEKAWIASWDATLNDARIVLPSLTGTPVIQTTSTSREVTHVLPVTVFGVAYDRYSVAASVIPLTRFSDGDAPGGALARSEFDVNGSYAITPNLSASLIYKAGKISSGSTAAAAQFSQSTGYLKLKGILLGLAGSVPVGNDFKLYGNAAYGPGHTDFDIPGMHLRNRISYSIVEVGATYGISNNRFAAVVFNAGYRAQVVRLKGLPFSTISLQGVPISSESRDVVSTTHGPIIGATVSFY